MAKFLYAVGRWSFTKRWTVLAVWVVLLAAMGGATAALKGTMSNAFSIPGTESTQTLNLIDERMPGAGVRGANARVVFQSEPGQPITAPEKLAGITAAVQEFSKLPHVSMVIDPVNGRTISPNGTTAFAVVKYNVQSSELTADDMAALQAAGDKAKSAGLTVNYGGDGQKPPPAGHTAEAIGVAVAGLVLFLTFGSLLTAGMPLITALLGVGLGMMGIQIASGFFDMSTTSGSLATMLGLAVGIDYALFVVSRYRHELLTGRTGPDAAGYAVGTAGSAVVFAGATVIIALAALGVADIPFLTVMGWAAAATVAIAVIIAVTLLPALLGILGDRVLGRKGRAARDAEGDDATTAQRPSFATRWAKGIVGHRFKVIAAVVIGLAALSFPAADLHLGMPSDASAKPDSTQRKAYDALSAGFGPGFNGPLIVTADLRGSADRQAAVAALQQQLPAVPGVALVTPATLNGPQDFAMFNVIPKTGPDDTATQDLVHAIRDRRSDWQGSTGAAIAVTGVTAVNIDISEKLANALPVYLAVVVGLAFLLLMLVFRSLIVPLKATLGFLLSLAATIGAVVAVFQKGWGASLLGVESTGPILSFLPILTIGVLFGLAMDYQVFLVTRMREEHVHGADAQKAVVQGFSHGALIVAAAALIMVSVFGGFMFADDAIMKVMGFALAAGVIFDALIVRMTLVPALLSVLGETAWWIPKWLDKIMPNVDVEGEGLAKRDATLAVSADDDGAAISAPPPKPESLVVF